MVANEVKVKVPGVTSRRGADKSGLDMPRREVTPGTLDIVLEPLDPGIAFERVIVDRGARDIGAAGVYPPSSAEFC